LNLTTGPAPVFYTRRDDGATSAKEQSLFDGLDTSLAGAYRVLGLTAPAGAVDRLQAIARQARAARDAFTWTDPSDAVPALARGLAAVRRARATLSDPDVADLLDVKEQQFVDALVAASASRSRRSHSRRGCRIPPGRLRPLRRHPRWTPSPPARPSTCGWSSPSVDVARDGLVGHCARPSEPSCRRRTRSRSRAGRATGDCAGRHCRAA
jgi:hypothetical protein